MADSLLIDSEFRSLIPPLEPSELALLEESILEEGVRDALVIWNGYIVDGHNRYDIITKHGIADYRVVNKNFSDKDEAKIWIMKNQIGRRNVAPYLRAEYYFQVAEWEEARRSAKENIRKGAKEKQPFVNSQKADNTQKLALKLGVGEQTASRIIQIHQKAPEELKEKLRKGEASINEVYNKVKPKNKAQSERMKPKFDRLKELESQGIYIGSVWDFAKRADYAGDGNFHGNCIPQIVENAILFYTKEGDIVCDPMAGSGTTIDVCRQINRQCCAFDIHILRDDIKWQDARNMRELQSDSIDFVFLHPPYWKLVTYSKDGQYPEDISRQSYNNFLSSMSLVSNECHRVLKKGKVLALLIGDMVNEGAFIPISIPVFNQFCDSKFTPVGIAIKTTEGSRSQVKKGKTIWAELAVTQNLKIEHDFVMLFRK